jgi:glycosyltransferase involved in cell wall biosynthesis/FMN phosphatase YigB (HAD superfamily)
VSDPGDTGRAASAGAAGARRLVVLDIDDTLYLERDYARSGFTAIGEWARAELGVDDLGERAWAAFEAGTRGTIFDEALAAAGVEPSPELVPSLVEVYRSHAPDIVLHADARAWLDGLPADVTVAVVTDGPLASQRAKAEALGLDRWAEHIVFTAQLGPDRGKPHPAAFELLERTVGLSDVACAYVADNPAKDFRAPHALGWRTVRVRRSGGLHANVPSGDDIQAEIHTFGDLDAALDGAGVIDDDQGTTRARASVPRSDRDVGGDAPVKVAHLTTVDSSLWYLLRPQLTAVRDRGADSIGISAPGPDVARIEADGVRHIPLTSSTRSMNPLADLAAARELWRILRRERPDVLHTHNPKPGLYGRVVGRLARVPVVVNTCHGLYYGPGDPWLKRTILLALEGVAARFSDAELVQGEEDLDRLVRSHAYPRRRTRLLGNGIDLGRFRPDVLTAGARADLRAEIGATDDQIVVGMVGRLVAEKGLLELFDAARRLEDRFVVAVVGPDDPAKPDALDRATVAAAEADGVRILGMRDDVDRLYGAMDLFVLPSWREGFPRAAMEAAASGLPVIASDVRGCRQVVDHDVTGLLVPVRDGEALAAAIVELGDDPERRATMGKAAVERAQERFDERRIVGTVLDTYRDVAERKGLTAVAATVSEVPA